jgi:ABC-type microcin C transport system duplicated ATPase subunit YejF
MRLLGASGKIVDGQVIFKGRDLVQLPEDEMVRIRGNELSMIFQQPTSCLNPVFQIGAQVAEVLEIHQGVGREGLEAGHRDVPQGRHPRPRTPRRPSRTRFPAARPSA